MATHGTPIVPLDETEEPANSAAKRPWLKPARLSSIADRVDAFLDNSGFDRGPWLVVCFALGIASWFGLDAPWQWASFIVAALLVAFGAANLWREHAQRSALMLAAVSMALVTAAGTATVWTRSTIVGQEAIEHPRVSMLSGRVLTRQEQPAQERVRITLATRDAESGQAIKVRVNVPSDKDIAGLEEGSVVRLRARLMPPAAPILPGAYNFARRAWFDGLAATGSLIGEIELIEAASSDSFIAQAQRSLSRHVREQLSGASGTIAATLASGDRGSIAKRDEEAMRDAGLTHLLSISGLHVSAVIAAAYFVAIKLLALWPWLTLRVRLPVLAAGLAALAGIGYTLLTGAQVPTVRSCIGALLVLLALALGREPLSMRMVAVAAMVVLLLWPESLVGPSFQMSFAAVIAIIALHSSGPVRAFLAPREEAVSRRWGRRVAMLFLTGLVIELTLMPIVLFHFHRAGLYGALANVIAIPLVTFISMPLVAIALLLDQIGLGAPAWWLVGVSIDGLLGVAHFTASQPGAVKLLPELSIATLLLFIAGGLWLALWNGKMKLLALVPIATATVMVLFTQTPDVLITRDGRHVAITGEGDKLLVLRDSKSSYAKDNLLELAGVDSDVLPLDQWPGAHCSNAFCVLTLTRSGREWTLLMARNKDLVSERRLAAACDQSDIVIADRWLPRSCQPRWLKADKRFLEREGGISLFLTKPSYRSVGESQGEHGWWRGRTR